MPADDDDGYFHFSTNFSLFFATPSGAQRKNFSERLMNLWIPLLHHHKQEYAVRPTEGKKKKRKKQIESIILGISKGFFVAALRVQIWKIAYCFGFGWAGDWPNAHIYHS